MNADDGVSGCTYFVFPVGGEYKKNTKFGQRAAPSNCQKNVFRAGSFTDDC